MCFVSSVVTADVSSHAETEGLLKGYSTKMFSVCFSSVKHQTPLKGGPERFVASLVVMAKIPI